MVKNLLAMQETRARSLGREDPLKKGMATHSSILAWRTESHGQKGPVGYSLWACKVSAEWLSTHLRKAISLNASTSLLQISSILHVPKDG